LSHISSVIDGFFSLVPCGIILVRQEGGGRGKWIPVQRQGKWGKQDSQDYRKE